MRMHRLYRCLAASAPSGKEGDASDYFHQVVKMRKGVFFQYTDVYTLVDMGADYLYSAGMMRKADTSQYVEDELVRLLVAGAWQAGDRIPEARLARQLGVSRTPVREAMRRLVAAGVLDQLPNQVPCVRSPRPEELIQLYDLRMVLEGYGAECAAQSATEVQCEKLYAAAEAFLAFAESMREMQLSSEEVFEKIFELERQFHREMTLASNHPWLIEMLEKTNLLSAVFFRIDRQEAAAPDEVRVRRSYERHRHIAELVAEKKGAEARAFVISVLEETRDREVIRV